MKQELLAVMLFAMATIGVARADGTNKTPEATKPPEAATAAEAAKATEPPPKIQFDKTVYDFGSTSFVDSVTGTFTFQNAGTGELKVGKPQPSCGCTVASVKPEVLKPGEKGELVFKVNVGGAHGSLEKHITVPSNDPQTPKLSLSVKANIVQIVEVAPAQINLGQIRQGMITNVSATLRRTDGKKLAIGKTEPSSKLLRAKVEPVEGSNDQSAKLLIEVEGEGSPRRFNESVKVFVEGIAQPAATIAVNGQLLGDVLVDHESLYWPITDASHAPATNAPALPTRKITVSSTRPDHALEIKNLATSLKDLSLELVTVEAGKTYSVVAKFAETPKASEQGTISFDTNASLQPKITIPVTVTVLK
jgi:hypothetical protein